MALVFTQADLDNLKAALVSGTLEVQIGDRRIKYRSQKELLEAIQMVVSYLDGVDTSADSAVMVQATFSKGGNSSEE